MRTEAAISALTDTFLLSTPLLVCLIIFAFFGDNLANFLALPEWSFFSAFLLIEVLKEEQSLNGKSQKIIMQSKSSVCMYCALIVTAVTIMVLAFADSRGYLAQGSKFKDLAVAQQIIAIGAVLLALRTKYLARCSELRESEAA